MTQHCLHCDGNDDGCEYCDGSDFDELLEPDYCEYCDGTDWDDVDFSGELCPCPYCDGSGENDDPLFPRPCPECDGTGERQEQEYYDDGEGD